MKKLLFYFTLFTLFTSSLCAQYTKTYVIGHTPTLKVYVDSQYDNKAYLCVIEVIKKEPAQYRFCRYEIHSLDPDSSGVRYILNANQYCVYNHVTKQGTVCEQQTQGIKCTSWKNEDDE